MTGRDVELTQTAGPEEIRDRQLVLLRRHLDYLQQHSPYYREVLRAADFEPRQLRTLEQLADLPLTDKHQLAVRNQDFLAVAEEQVVDICQTSGTTGEPVTIWQTEADLQRLARNEEAAFTAAGIRRNDRVLIGAALDRSFMAGLAYFLGLRRIGATIIRGGSGQLALIGELIRQYRPTVLVGVPSLFLALGRQLQATGRNPVDQGVEKLICIGEPVSDEDLSLAPLGTALQELWGGQVLGTYASTEMATAFADCSAGCGGHLQPELMLVEIVDDQGRPVAPGEIGEVVATPLGIEGTPLLRYRTGDIARLHSEPCACGRQTPRLGPILGRRAQMLKCRGTTLFPAAIGNALLALPAVQGHYLEVYREHDLSDRLRVVVGSKDPELSADRVAEVLAAKIRFKPEVAICTPEELFRRTIRPDRRKPVTFFDFRNHKSVKDDA